MIKSERMNQLCAERSGARTGSCVSTVKSSFLYTPKSLAKKTLGLRILTPFSAVRTKTTTAPRFPRNELVVDVFRPVNDCFTLLLLEFDHPLIVIRKLAKAGRRFGLWSGRGSHTPTLDQATSHGRILSKSSIISIPFES